MEPAEFRESLVTNENKNKFRKQELQKKKIDDCILVNSIYRYLSRDEDGSPYEKNKENILDLREVDSELKNGGKRKRTKNKKNRKYKKSKKRKYKKSKNRKYKKSKIKNKYNNNI